MSVIPEVVYALISSYLIIDKNYADKIDAEEDARELIEKQTMELCRRLAGKTAIYYTDRDGHTRMNGLLHSHDNQPAVKYGNEGWIWYKNGGYHRDNDLPAMYCDKTFHWCINDDVHRENDQPAILYPDGKKEWYINGDRHRDNDQPAVECPSGKKEWYINGRRCRLNGKPNIEYHRNYDYDYESEYKRYVKLLQC